MDYKKGRLMNQSQCVMLLWPLEGINATIMSSEHMNDQANSYLHLQKEGIKDETQVVTLEVSCPFGEQSL